MHNDDLIRLEAFSTIDKQRRNDSDPAYNTRKKIVLVEQNKKSFSESESNLHLVDHN